jgi:hypothetical protein
LLSRQKNSRVRGGVFSHGWFPYQGKEIYHESHYESITRLCNT